jgi:hypothetical protein
MKGDGAEYECPDCGSSFAEGTERCPGCGAEVEWEGAPIAPSSEIEKASRDLDRLQDDPSMVEAESVLSRLGTVFALLTVLGFLGTLLILRWDTWVQGAEVDSIGDNQRLMVYGGAVATMAFAVASIIDVLRTAPWWTGPGERGQV